MTKALILIDIQNDFCEGGALAVKDASQILPIANQLIAQFRAQKQKIIVSLDWHPKNHKSFASVSHFEIGTLGELNGRPQVWWPDHCVQNTQGAALHPELDQSTIDFIVHKGENPEVDSYSIFFDNDQQQETDLNAYLKAHNINHLTMLGLATDYCVKFSVLDALKLGYSVDLFADGCRGVNLNENDSALAFSEMKKQGANIVVFS